MSVTELAILPLAPSVSLTLQSFRAKLSYSKKVMETALGVSGRRFVYYQGVEDPTVLYLLGDWQSPSEHWDHFIPSPENRQLLELLKDDLDIPRIEMYHVDVPNANVPADAKVVSIGWCRVRTEDKARFEEQALNSSNFSNENSSRDSNPAGGWRIEKPVGGKEDEEEWVRFCGWDNVGEHTSGAGSTELLREYDQFHNLVLGYEVKHGIRVDLGPES